MIRFRHSKHTVPAFIESSNDNSWYGKLIAFERIDSIVVQAEKFIIYTKQNKEHSFSIAHYKEFAKAYKKWISEQNDR